MREQFSQLSMALSALRIAPLPPQPLSRHAHETRLHKHFPKEARKGSRTRPSAFMTHVESLVQYLLLVTPAKEASLIILQYAVFYHN